MYRKFKKLRLRMLELDYSQKDAAIAAGIPPSTLCQRMCGRQPFDTDQIVRLAKVLEIPMNQIGEFFFEDTPTRKGA